MARKTFGTLQFPSSLNRRYQVSIVDVRVCDFVARFNRLNGSIEQSAICSAAGKGNVWRARMVNLLWRENREEMIQKYGRIPSED